MAANAIATLRSLPDMHGD